MVTTVAVPAVTAVAILTVTDAAAIPIAIVPAATGVLDGPCA